MMKRTRNGTSELSLISGKSSHGNTDKHDAGHREKPEQEPPNPEVAMKATRRRFSAKYKLKVLHAADACEPGSGELGELLRKEGLYASHLKVWRDQRAKGELEGLAPKKRGRKPKAKDPHLEELETLRRTNAELEAKLRQAERIIEIQGKVSELLGIKPSTGNRGENS